MSWLSKLFRKSEPALNPDDLAAATPTLEEISAVLPQFGKLLEAHSQPGMTVFDVQTLPVPKRRLETILMFAIGITEDEEQAQQLAVGLLSLADYHDGVGPTPLLLQQMFSKNNTTVSDVADRAEAMEFVLNKSTKTYASFLPAVQAESVRL